VSIRPYYQADEPSSRQPTEIVESFPDYNSQIDAGKQEQAAGEQFVRVQVKNIDTLDEYLATTSLDAAYLPKVEKWLHQKKYSCEERAKELTLSVNGCFVFQLKRSSKSDSELIREELQAIKREKQLIMRDLKLFNYYFYSFWKEKFREHLLERDYLCETIVDSPQNLYNICEGLAIVEEEEYGAKRTFIGFKQPLAFLYHTGNTRLEEQMISGSQNLPHEFHAREGQFEVFISGKGQQHNLALIASKWTKKVFRQDKDCSFYLHKVNLPLHHDLSYTVFTPKIFT